MRAKANRISRILVAVALIAASFASLVVVNPRPAEAISDFDAEILAFINDYRESIGLNPLIEHASLSDAADGWATEVAQRLNNSFCPSHTTDVPDNPADLMAEGTPASTVEVIERTATSCGVHGIEAGGTGGVGTGTGPDCSRAEKDTRALGIWCALYFDLRLEARGGELAIIEDPSFTHIGLSSRRTNVNGADFTPIDQFTVFRFARTVTGCDAAAVTIDMNANGGNGVGTPGDDVILGTPGDDRIEGLGGNDVICAGGGNDVVIGGTGNDVIFGDSGDDTVRGNAGIDTIDGGDGADRLLGGTEADNLFGGDGDDFIGGFGGNDFMSGGIGDDTMFGGFGADVINGDEGGDEIRGLVGDDVINGGGGSDSLFGDRGNDTINGGNADDVINGGNANDTLNGDGGDDTVNGGKGNDNLSGGNGTDTCAGNLDADTADVSCEKRLGIP